MGLFNIFKKYHEVDYESLAAAIAEKSYVQSQIEAFKKFWTFKNNSHSWDKEEIFKVDEHISIHLTHARIYSDLWNDKCYMETSTYIDGIEVNKYTFCIHLDCDHPRWGLSNKDIIHKISNEMIDAINLWAKENSKPYYQRIKDKKFAEEQAELEKQRNFEDEEKKLQNSMKNYKK